MIKPKLGESVKMFSIHKILFDPQYNPQLRDIKEYLFNQNASAPFPDQDVIFRELPDP